MAPPVGYGGGGGHGGGAGVASGAPPSAGGGVVRGGGAPAGLPPNWMASSNPTQLEEDQAAAQQSRHTWAVPGVGSPVGASDRHSSAAIAAAATEAQTLVSLVRAASAVVPVTVVVVGGGVQAAFAVRARVCMQQLCHGMYATERCGGCIVLARLAIALVCNHW